MPVPVRRSNELVTKQFLRAELGDLRFEMVERFHRQTVWLASTVVAAAGAVIAAVPVLS